MEKLEFKFTAEEMNYIFNALTEKPFREVQGLLNNIQEQFQEHQAQQAPEMEVVEE